MAQPIDDRPVQPDQALAVLVGLVLKVHIAEMRPDALASF
jgi:hypothetical protein